MADRKHYREIIAADGYKRRYKLDENGKTNVGRPTKKVPTVIKKLVEEFRNDATVEDACSYAGISVAAFYEWIKKDKDFMEEIDRAVRNPFKKARNVLVTLMDSKKEEIKFKAASEFLSKRDSRYKSKSEETVKTLELEEDEGDNIKNKNMLDLEEMRKNMLGF